MFTKPGGVPELRNQLLKLDEEMERERARLQEYSALAVLWLSVRILTSTLSSVSPWLPVVKCLHPPAITNGKLQGNTSDTFFYGASVSYSCDSGYSLSGDAFITCTASGTWSHPPPQCKGVCVCEICGPKSKQQNILLLLTLNSTHLFALGTISTSQLMMSITNWPLFVYNWKSIKSW